MNKNLYLILYSYEYGESFLFIESMSKPTEEEIIKFLFDPDPTLKIHQISLYDEDNCPPYCLADYENEIKDLDEFRKQFNNSAYNSKNSFIK